MQNVVVVVPMRWPRKTRQQKPAQAEYYPPYIVSQADRERWDLAQAIAERTFEGTDPATVWMATRSIFNNSDIPTDEESSG